MIWIVNYVFFVENMSQFDNDITVSSNSMPKMKSYSRGIQRDDSSVEGVLYDESSCWTTNTDDITMVEYSCYRSSNANLIDLNIS